MEEKVLHILENNCRISFEQMAVMLDTDTETVRRIVERLEKEGIIVGYKSLINWERTTAEKVKAIIELKVTPQRGKGFDAVAEKIYKYPQVASVYLMSGGFDLGVIVEGKTMKEVALFVAEVLAPIEEVISTATHFVLKTFKDHAIEYIREEKDTRQVISL